MFERFTDSFRKAMTLAKQEARRYNHEYIGTEHILLGLAKEDEGIGFQVLHNFSIEIDKLRNEIEKQIKIGDNTMYQDKLPQTPQTKKVIEWAIDEARALNNREIGTEHLLLGLLKAKDSITFQVLNTLGVTYVEAREKIMNFLGRNELPREKANTKVSQDTDKNQIQVFEIENSLTKCPECEYDGGFHNIFCDINNKQQAKWILVCPNCKMKFDIGLRCPK
jgi:ATP-dependent Clp protease ATP-binding subunit ClpC